MFREISGYFRNILFLTLSREYCTVNIGCGKKYLTKKQSVNKRQGNKYTNRCKDDRF